MAAYATGRDRVPDELPAWQADRVAVFNAGYSEKLPQNLRILLPLDGAGRLVSQIVEDSADAIDGK